MQSATIAERIQRLLDGLQLPPRIHATVLTGRDVADGSTLAYPVVWADRITAVCDQCGQPAPREVGCPVALNTGAGQGGRVEEFDQKHGCGNWLSVPWEEVDADVKADDADQLIEQAARELAARRQEGLAAERDRIRRRLDRELRWTLRELATPLDPGETPDQRIDQLTTGADVQPGVYLDDTSRLAWVAWDYDPATEDGAEVIEVAAESLTYGQAAAMLGVSRQQVQRLAAGGKLEAHQDGGVTVASVLRRREERSEPA